MTIIILGAISMLNIFTPTTSSCFYGFEKAQNHIQLKCFNMMLNHLIIVSIIAHVHVKTKHLICMVCRYQIHTFNFASIIIILPVFIVLFEYLFCILHLYVYQFWNVIIKKKAFLCIDVDFRIHWVHKLNLFLRIH